MNVHVASAFFWPLPSRYEWIDAREVDDDGAVASAPVRVLVPRDAQTEADHAALTDYEPLVRDTGLFLQVAALKPAEEAILAFATKFGPLGLDRLWIPKGIEVRVSKNSPKLRPNASRVDKPIQHLGAAVTWEHYRSQGGLSGDSLERWTRLINNLGDLVHAWHALASTDTDQFESAFQTNRRHGKTELQLRTRDDHLVKSFDFEGAPPKGKLRKYAERLLLLAVNEHLQAKFRFGLNIGDGIDRSWFVIEPESLEAAIWLQFTQAILGNRAFRECEACGTPFEVSLDAFRTNRTLCSKACKARAHRMRRAEALALAAKGKTPKQIAKQVNSKLETIEKWLEEREDE